MANSGIGGPIHAPAQAGQAPLPTGRAARRRPPVRNPAARGRGPVPPRHGLRAASQPRPR